MITIATKVDIDDDVVNDIIKITDANDDNNNDMISGNIKVNDDYNVIKDIIKISDNDNNDILAIRIRSNK